MASVSHKLVLSVVALCCLVSSAPQYSKAHPLKICKFDQIYQLGDSISDTGNLIREVPVGAATAFARPPYGEIFFKNATGRCSNGLLMIDYIGKIFIISVYFMLCPSLIIFLNSLLNLMHIHCPLQYARIVVSLLGSFLVLGLLY